MINKQPAIADFTDMGKLGVMHLKRYHDKASCIRSGAINPDAFAHEWNIDTTLLAVLGLGLEQTIKQLFNSPGDFNDFENWILQVNNGYLNTFKIETFNTYIRNRQSTYQPSEGGHVQTEADLEFWNTHGYIIIREAIPAADCENTIEAICNHIHVKRDDPSTWYQPHPARQGIMVQLFQHPALEKNRLSPKIRAAYEQLWQRKDLWVNTDRVGFNPPETGEWKFPGPGLHWDVSLALPIPFGLQGILYLADTKPSQGAFTLVPGFQHSIANWLNGLSPETNPRTEDLHALGAQPIAASAGDFIIWHQALPHGSSANCAEQPRFVQYINYAPLDAEVNTVWK